MERPVFARLLGPQLRRFSNSKCLLMKPGFLAKAPVRVSQSQDMVLRRVLRRGGGVIEDA